MVPLIKIQFSTLVQEGASSRLSDFMVNVIFKNEKKQKKTRKSE